MTIWLKTLRQWLTPRRRHILTLVVVSLGLRVFLIYRWPIVFGGDTILRLANRDHILVSYNLPALQAVLHYLSYLSSSVALSRYAMAAIGTAAAIGFYLLSADLLEERIAFLAALLFTSNPFLLALSTVPYQESLMMAGLFFAFHYFFAENLIACSLALGVACLTRYEAWAACPVLLMTYVMSRDRRPYEMIKAIAIFGWAPLVWLIWRHGFSPAGTFVLDPRFSPWRFMRYAHLGWTVVKYTPIAVLLLTLIGAFALMVEKAYKRQPRLIPFVAFVLLFVVALLFSAHGVSPDPERYLTAREAHLLIATAILLAGFGLARTRQFGPALVTIGFLFGVFGAIRYVQVATSDPSVQLSYTLAKALDSHVRADERVIVLTKPIPQVLVDNYLQMVMRTSGAAGIVKAREVMRSMDTSPPDYQRTLVHSRIPPSRLLNFASQAAGEWSRSEWPDTHAEWIAVWSNFAPANALEQHIYMTEATTREPVQVLRAGDMSIALYHRAADTTQP